MLFNEYIKIFEEVLALTEQIETLCMQFKSDETDELIHKRSQLMSKLDVPQDIDEEKFAQILAIKDKISEKNANILSAMQKEKEIAQKTVDEIKKNAAKKNLPESSTETKIRNTYKKPNDGDMNSSIFK